MKTYAKPFRFCFLGKTIEKIGGESVSPHVSEWIGESTCYYQVSIPDHLVVFCDRFKARPQQIGHRDVRTNAFQMGILQRSFKFVGGVAVSSRQFDSLVANFRELLKRSGKIGLCGIANRKKLYCDLNSFLVCKC